MRRVGGAVHAGWRGTALKIAAKAVERMVDCYGCDRRGHPGRCRPPADSPSAASRPTEDGTQRHDWRGHGGRRLSSIEVLPTGKFHVDLKGLNAKRLESAGLAPEHIAVSADCTCCLPEKYWSHRYTHGERGARRR